jgi:hypothetical protein
VTVRREKGEVIVETPPRDPMLTMHDKYDLAKLDNHVGRVRAFKYTSLEGKSPTRSGSEALTYRVGDIVSVKKADKSKSVDCSYGINLASKDWIKPKVLYGSYRVFACEFEIEDLAAVPSGSDGKFRVFKCEVMEELDPETFEALKVTKIVDAIEPVTGDPLTQPIKERLAARKRKVMQKAMDRSKALEKKLLPAVVLPDVIEKPKVITPPERRIAPKKQSGWFSRLRKRLGFDG